MKKIIFLIPVFFLINCSGLVKNEMGSENLISLDERPENCVFLKRLDVNISVYSSEDAVRFLENSIAKKSETADSYWIYESSQEEIPDAVFGPKQSYILKANVYNCL